MRIPEVKLLARRKFCWVPSVAALLLSSSTVSAQPSDAGAKQSQTVSPAKSQSPKGSDQPKPPSNPAVDTPARKTTETVAPKLEDLLVRALKDNPDIRVAEAKLREAEAELNRTRLQVTQKVVTFHYALQSQQTLVKENEAQLARMQNLARSGVVQHSELELAQQTLIRAKAKVAAIEAEMPYLIGKQPATAEGPADVRKSYHQLYWTFLDNEGASQAVQGTAADKLRKSLDTTIAIDVAGGAALGDVLALLEEKVPGVTFRILAAKDGAVSVNLRLKQEVPLGAVLQALEDSVPGLRFVVRDYGILVTAEDRVPSGAMDVQYFWKGGGLEQASHRLARARGTDPNDTEASRVEGVVKSIDLYAGLVTISIGSDDGVAKGSTLDVFRLTPKPQYLGEIHLLEVNRHEAVGKPARAGGDVSIQVGDKVTNKGQIKR
jgi:hypothetical protein